MSDLVHVHSGKVRDLYAVGDDQLLMVASDRMSAFDVIMAEPIPNKGRVLTAMTAFWVHELGDLAQGQTITADPAEIARLVPASEQLGNIAGRAVLVRRAEMVPLECIVRSRLTGSAYKEYLAQGTVHGMVMPEGMQMSQAFDAPIFTPSTKAEVGGKDENLTFVQAVALVGAELAESTRDLSLQLFARGFARAEAAGLVLADTKFEFGLIDGQLVLCDEVMTPDSSRMWPADEVRLGEIPPAFDKQPLRDWLEAQGWDKKPPPPPLPDDIVAQTSARYQAAYERVTGRRLSDWYGDPE